MYAKPLGNNLNKARFVNVLNLRNTNLDDQKAIEILSGIDRAVVTNIDLSENPKLTSKSYQFLTDMIADGANLQWLELEKNQIDHGTLERLLTALTEA